MRKSKFVIFNANEGECQFHLIDPEGNLLLTSDGFKVKQSCISTIVSAKLHGRSERNFQKLKTKEGGYYVNLRSKHHEVLATSPSYSSPILRESAIELMKNGIQSAILEDRTFESVEQN